MEDTQVIPVSPSHREKISSLTQAYSLPTHLLSLYVFGCIFILSVPVAAEMGDQPLAVIFGEKLYAKDLMASSSAKPDSKAAIDPDTEQRVRGEALRTRVWKAAFEDYARKRNIAPTEAEITWQIEGHQRMKLRTDAERARQRAALIDELKSPNLTDSRRKAAQQHLDVLNQSMEFDAKRTQELRDPAQKKIQQDAERRVAEYWVRAWKLNQTLYREYGGRIAFQQAGWEPIDAYRKLLDQYAAEKAFVVSDPALRAAVYSYFDHKFVYADETKARFYFEKPYWERTPEEMKAAGF